MRRLIVLFLTTSCATAQVSEAEIAPTIDLDLSGKSAPFYDDEGNTCLPPDLAQELNVQREEARVLPERCQIRLDVLRERLKKEREGLWWTRLQWGLGGAAVGVILMGLAMGLGGT